MTFSMLHRTLQERKHLQAHSRSDLLELNDLIIPVMDYGSQRPGLGYDDLNDPSRPLLLQTPLNIQQYQLGDYVILYWNEIDVQHFPLEQSHFDTSFIGFSVPVTHIREPQGVTYYTVFDQLSGATVPSKKRTVRVKFSPPGGLDPDISTPYLNERLKPPVVSPATIPSPAPTVTVTVPAWDNMAQDDQLVVSWNGIRLVQPPLPLGEVGQPQTITIPADVLIDAGSGDALVVNYEIRDIVNNYSLVSRPAYANVIDPNAPPAPLVRVRGQTVSLIDLVALGTDNPAVFIPVYPGIVVGDEITLTWLGKTPDGQQVRVVVGPAPVADAFFPLEFAIPNADVVAIAGGSAVLGYSIQPALGTSRSSKTATVTVNGTAQPLPAPSVDNADGLKLDPEVITGDPVVRMQPYPGKHEGDVIHLEWTGTTATQVPLVYSASYTVRAGEENTDAVFQVPRAYFAPLVNGTLAMIYRVTSGVTGTDRPSMSITYTVVGETTVTDDFTRHSADLITVGGSMITEHMTIRFVRGTGQAGIVVGYRPPGEAGTQFKNPVFQVCHGTFGTQSLEFKLNKPCRKVTCDVHGAKYGDTMIRFMGQGGNELSRQLPQSGSQVVISGATTEPITTLLIDSQNNDWTLWDNVVLDLWIGALPAPLRSTATVATTRTSTKRSSVMEKPKRDSLSLLAELTADVICLLAARSEQKGSEAFSEPGTVGLFQADTFPAPSVTGAVGGVLDPLLANPGGVQVVVAYTSMDVADTIALSWNGIATYPAKYGSVFGSVTFDIPMADVAAAIGKTIQVVYSVVRPDGPLRSDILTLTVSTIPPGQMPTPQIIQAVAGVLNVTALTADADLTCAVWPLIAAGQKLWLTLDGSTGPDPAPWVAFPITSAGPQSVKIPLAYLQGLTDASTLRLILEVSFDNGVTRQPFPIGTVTIKAAATSIAITAVRDSQNTLVPDGGTTTDTTVTLYGTVA
jgi:hypothetical protein